MQFDADTTESRHISSERESMAIDTHAHYVPAEVLHTLEESARDFGIALHRETPQAVPALHFDYGLKVRPFFPKLIETVEQRLSGMAEMGVTHQVLSQWTDIFGYGLPPSQAVAWHRLMNSAYQKLCAAYPEHFSFMASVPLNSGELAAAEAAHAVQAMGAVGICVAANVDEVNLGDIALDPLWSKLQELGVPLMIHPVQAVPGSRVNKYALTQVVQYPYDTTLAIGSLIGSGVFDRFAGLNVLLSHGGGLLPFLIGRFDRLHSRMNKQQQHYAAENETSFYLKNLYFDTIVHSPRTLRFLAETVSTDRIVLGTDYSFPPADMAPLSTLQASQLSDIDRGKIANENALALFPGLKTQLRKGDAIGSPISHN
ncbi:MULTISPECIES: amidohydrolase family protein [Rhizobium]|nr:amidohydrolase family protein [Rhizobium lusitanum]